MVGPGADPDALQRFREETRIAARPRPSLDRAASAPPGDEGEVLWYAMELVEGPSLAEWRGPAHDAAEARALGEALADALAYSHARRASSTAT